MAEIMKGPFPSTNMAPGPFQRKQENETQKAPVASRLAAFTSHASFSFLLLIKASYIKGKQSFLHMATLPFKQIKTSEKLMRNIVTTPTGLLAPYLGHSSPVTPTVVGLDLSTSSQSPRVFCRHKYLLHLLCISKRIGGSATSKEIYFAL